MNLEKLFRMTLLEDAAVAALVLDRVHPDDLPQGSALPAIVYRQEDGIDEVALTHVTGPQTRRFGLDLHGDRRDDARKLAVAVKGRLEAVTPGAEGLEIQGMFLVSSLSRFDGETRTYVVEQDWDVKFSGPEVETGS